MRVLTVAAALAAAAVLATGCGASPGAHPPSAAATVTCSLTTCAHGSVGQACRVGGYPGIVVQADSTALACDPSPAPESSPQPVVTDPDGVTCASLDSLGYCPGDDPTPASVTLNINVVLGCQYGDTNTPSFSAGPCTTGPPDDADYNSIGPDGDANDAYLDAGQENAYQVTVTNSNDFAVNVSQVTVGYYDAQGDELSSAGQNLGIVQIAAGATVTAVYGYTDAPAGTVSVSATGYSA
jgi:hypothetical protein